MSTRSSRADVRNPALLLPGMAKLRALPVESREAIADVFMDVRRDAAGRADKCWKKHKAPMAAYWKAVSVYAGHVARAIKKG